MIITGYRFILFFSATNAGALQAGYPPPYGLTVNGRRISIFDYASSKNQGEV
jgi:hypothetical protein